MLQNNELLLVDQIQLASGEAAQEVRYRGACDPNKTHRVNLNRELPDRLLVVGDRVTVEYSHCDTNGRIIKVERNVEKHAGRTAWKKIWSQEPCKN